MSGAPPSDVSWIGWIVLMVGPIYLWLFAVLVWGIWIEHYIVKNGERPASFVLTFFTGWGILRDYRTARKIAARHRHKPWFLTCFEWLAGLGMLGIIGAMVCICIASFR
jgi:hypothetical protein